MPHINMKRTISSMNFSEDLVFLLEIECFVGMVHWFASISARISCEEWQDQSLLPTNRVNTGVGQSDLAVFFIYAPTTDLEQDRFQAKSAFTQ